MGVIAPDYFHSRASPREDHEEVSMRDRARVRARALRAARVVAVGTALGGVPLSGCYRAHEPAAAFVAREDAGTDSGTDAGSDAGFCDPAASNWLECCDAIHWDQDRGCLAWGPFVPPADGEQV